MIRYVVLCIFLAIPAYSIDNQGILVFGYNGTVYNFTANECNGGIVFRKPVQLEFICASGFYLHRTYACSHENERVIGSSTFGCMTDVPSTQALILLSNEELPNAHTIAFYDDEDLLTSFRKHVVGDKTVKDDPSSDFAIVSSPANVSMNIGRVCYNGENFDGAIKLYVQDIQLADSKGVFTTPCDANSVLATMSEKFPGLKTEIPVTTTTMPTTTTSAPTTVITTEPTTVGFENVDTETTEITTELITEPPTVQLLNDQEDERKRVENIETDNSVVEKREIKHVKDSDILIDIGRVAIDDDDDEKGSDANKSDGEKSGEPGNASKDTGSIGESASSGTSKEPAELAGKVDAGLNGTDENGDQAFEQAMGGSELDESEAFFEVPEGEQDSDTLLELGDDENEDGANLQFMEMTPDDPDYQFSAEEDQIGSWESLSGLLSAQEFDNIGVPGTLEHDASIGGVIAVLSDSSTSPELESLITVLKSQVSGLLKDPSNQDYSLQHMQPDRAQWYTLISLFIEVTKAIVPDEIVIDEFFDHALLVFGSYTKHVSEINTIRYDKFKSIVENMESCAARAKNLGLDGLFKVKENSLDCDVRELDTAYFPTHEFNSQDKTDTSDKGTIHYESSDPNTYLPPLRSRIKRSVWIFTEIIWYALQLSYSFCFDEFAESDPNSFFNMVFYVIENLFIDNAVLNIWNSRKSGNLEVFETLLPFVQHSARVSGSSNAQDFSNLLSELDKISHVAHETSILNHWLIRPTPSTYPVYGKQNHTHIAQARAYNILMRGRKKRDLDVDDNETEALPQLIIHGDAVCVKYQQDTLTPSINDLLSAGLCD